MNLITFFKRGAAAQAAVDALPRGAMAEQIERAKTIERNLESARLGEQVVTVCEACREAIASVAGKRREFHKLDAASRGFLAIALEQVGKCAFALAEQLRGAK